MREKTDSAGSSKILLPGSWNWVLRKAHEVWEGNGSELNLECVFGASNEAQAKSNIFILKDLAELRSSLALVGAVH